MQVLLNIGISLEQLYQTIEQHTRISPENQILMTSYGNIVKKDNVQQVIHATGDVKKQKKIGKSFKTQYFLFVE